MTESAISSFHDLNLPKQMLSTIEAVGYETPSPIQAQAIPYLLEGHDLLGHAPTGTGKTAAFALPLISRLDMKQQHVQIMTLTPTRELAIQVAEAFQRYATGIKNFHVLPIYGGQDYSGRPGRGRYAWQGHGSHAQRHAETGPYSGHGAR